MNETEFYRNIWMNCWRLTRTIKSGDLLADLEKSRDSVAVISFIAMADEKYGVNTPAKRIAECRSVG